MAWTKLVTNDPHRDFALTVELYEDGERPSVGGDIESPRAPSHPSANPRSREAGAQLFRQQGQDGEVTSGALRLEPAARGPSSG